MSHSSKLEPKWKGPYEIVEVLPKGAYKLSYQGRILKTSVNGSQLRKINLEKEEPMVVIESYPGKLI